MGKLTYVITNKRNFSRKGRVVLDGTTVHASRPEDCDSLVQFPNATEKEALATFKKVIEKYFHPRDGWTLEEKKPGVADLDPWEPDVPEASPEEKAAQEFIQRQRKLGWAIDGDLMVIELKRQKRRNDLEIAIENGAGVRILQLITGPDDEDTPGTAAVFALLEAGALPRLAELIVDCPWETQTRVSSWTLPGLASLVKKRATFERISAVGEVDWPECTQPKLHTLGLLNRRMPASTIESVAQSKAPFKTLTLGFTVEGATDPAAEAAVTSLPLGQLEMLTLVGVNDVPGMVTRLLDGKKLPKALRIDGECHDDDELVALAAEFKKRAPPLSTLAFGDAMLSTCDEATRAAVEAALGEGFTSPFNVHDPRAQLLWKIFA